MINKFQCIAIAVCVFFLLLANIRPAFSQFRGNIELNGSRSTNVEGRDTSSPDGVIQPLLQLDYNLTPSPFSMLLFSGSLGNYFYTKSPDRSYFYTSISATGNFYLSNHDKIAQEAKPRTEKTTAPPSSSVHSPKMDSSKDIKPVAVENARMLDIPLFITQLSALGDHLDSLPIVSATRKKSETSFKDSASIALFALADILEEQDFTESVKSVIIEELSSIRDLMSKVEISQSEQKKAISRLNAMLSQLTKTSANSDLIPVPAQAVSHNDDNIEAADFNSSMEEAPLVTLISTYQFMYSQYSYTNISLREDADIVTAKTIATHLSVPASLQYQKNQDTYKIYTNTVITIAPHLEIFPSNKAILGTGYQFSLAQFPNDTLFDYIDNRFVENLRAEVTSNLVFFGSVGIGLRHYSHPFGFSDSVKIRKTVVRYNSPSNYTQFTLTSGFAFFPYERLSLGLFARITTKPSLDSPLYIVSLRKKGTFSGKAADDEYSYGTKGIYFYVTSRLPGDIDVGLDIQRESREYHSMVLIEQNRKPPAPFMRTDNVTILGLDISRTFYFMNRLASMFTAFTPTLTFTSSNVNSTFKGYSYRDFTSQLQLSFGF